jgi:molybdenum cofactor cytidylyltransferase
VTENVAAVLLAAGKSRRMESCKQLLPLAETTVIERCLGTLVSAGITEIVVVVAYEGDDVAKAADMFPARIAVNPQSDGDMASSVRVGRDALSPEPSGVIVALCDYPLVRPGTVAQLMAVHADTPGCIIIPRHEGRRGHPLLFPRTVLDELTGDMILRDLVRKKSEELIMLNVDDPGILIDMDTREDYLRILRMVRPELDGCSINY